MRTVIKIVAAALLSTTLSGAGMAAVDLNDRAVLADDAKLSQVKTIVHANTNDGFAYDIHFDVGLVDSLLAMDSTRFTKPQTKNFLEGMKSLYSDLAQAAGGSDRLKAKLSSTPLVASLILDTTTTGADVHNAVNAASLRVLTEAVIDDPFKAIDESFLALRGTYGATKPTTGSTKYVTFEGAIAAYERAKAVKDLIAAGHVLDEINKMRDGKGRSFQEIIAHKQEKTWSTADLRGAKAHAVDKAAAYVIELHRGLMTAAEDGDLDGLKFLPDAAGVDFNNPSLFKDPKNARQLAAVLVKAAREIENLRAVNLTLQRLLDDKKYGRAYTGPIHSAEPTTSSAASSGAASARATIYPAATELKERYQIELAQGASYDQATGVFTYKTGEAEQVKPKK